MQKGTKTQFPNALFCWSYFLSKKLSQIFKFIGRIKINEKFKKQIILLRSIKFKKSFNMGAITMGF